MSTAQSISNLCNQRAKDITAIISDINNISKLIVIDGNDYIVVEPKPLPENIISLIKDKAKLHAAQSFLMENIKAKDELINSIKREQFDFELVKPSPVMEKMEMSAYKLEVSEDWGWEQIKSSEYNEFLEAEAFAAHIGKFIHKGGKLDDLRSQLPNISSIEFMEIEVGKKTPMRVLKHHTQEQLLGIHEQLAVLHREYESKVNYFKSKVKNNVTTENARIAKENAQVKTLENEKNSLILNTFNL